MHPPHPQETKDMAGVPPGSGSLHVRFDEFELDEANARLLRAGSPVALAPTPFELLCALARQPGALLTKHALLDAVWGHRFVSDSVLKGAISDIRIALGDDPRQPRFIETVPRRGYRFVAQQIGRSACGSARRASRGPSAHRRSLPSGDATRSTRPASSSAAQPSWRRCSEPGSARAKVAGRWSGWLASPASARPP